MKNILLSILALLLTISVGAQDFTNFYTAYRAHYCIVTDDSLIYVGCPNAINIYYRDGSYKTSVGVGGVVYSAVRDNNGNLWFGVCSYDNAIGGALIKHDGYSWEIIPLIDSSIYSDITSIACDRNNNIWVAVNASSGQDAAKICKYDGTQWNDYSIFGDSLYLNEVDKIVCDSNNVIYAGVKSNCVTSYYNVITISETDTILYNGTNSAMTLACKHSSYVDRQNRVWFGGCFGHINSFENGLWTVHDDNSVFNNSSFTAIFQDNQFRMWLATGPNIFIQNDTGWTTNDYLVEQSIYAVNEITSDSEEQIWLASYFDYDDIRGGCLIKQVADSFELMYQKTHIGYPHEIAFNEDKIWLGKPHLSFFDGEIWYNSFTTDNISSDITTSVCTDSNGDLWYGTATGLFKQTTGQTAEQITQLCSEDITGIQCIASYNNNLWVKALERNLYKFDGFEWTKIDITNAAASIFKKIVPRDGNEIWVASTNGALKFDGTNWTVYTTDLGLMSNAVNDIAFQNDSVWIATIRGIALVYDQEISILHNDSTFLSGYSNYYSIRVDKHGTKWAGSKQGVLKFNSQFSEYLYPTGFNEEIYSIVEDPDHNLWFCGSRAISKYNFDNSGIENPIAEQNALTLYPNPASEKLSVYFSNLKENDVLEVISITGKVIASYKIFQESSTIDISTIKPGIYLLRLKKSGLHGKLIIE